VLMLSALLTLMTLMLGLAAVSGGPEQIKAAQDAAVAVAAQEAQETAVTTTTPCALLDLLFPKDSLGEHHLVSIRQSLRITQATASHYPSRDELLRILYHGTASPYVGLGSVKGRRLKAAAVKKAVFDVVNRQLGHSPKFVIEVGSYKGGGVVATWGPLARSNDGLCLCVDTWQGDVNMRLGAAFQRDMRLEHGFPTLGMLFMRAIVDAGLQDTVYPLSMPSLTAARLLAVLKWTIDLIFLDSAHEKGETLIELHMYYQLLRPGGILMGDDWEAFPAVRHDVILFAKCHNVTIQLLKDDHGSRVNTWLIAKPVV